MGARRFLASGSGAGQGHTDVGSGPTIVLIHDEGESPICWRGLVSELRGRYRVLAPALAAGTSVEAGATEILAALAEREVVHPHAIVGVGVGAYRALHLATWREVQVAVLALVEPVVSSLGLTGLEPRVHGLLSRLSAHVYLRCGERGARAACDLLAASTGAPLDVVRGTGRLTAMDLDTRCALVAAIDGLEAAVPPPLRVRQPTA